MAGSFLKTAQRQVTDISTFLKESAENSIRYRAEKGKKHHIYFPVKEVERNVQQEDGTFVVTKAKELLAITLKIHDWVSSDDKYHSCACMKDVVRTDENGNVLNDGSCPLCDRVADAWDIYNYRFEREKAITKLTGPNLDKHLENCKTNFANERKAKKAVPYMYVLIVQFKVNDQLEPVLEDDAERNMKLPAYELKVMKLSSSRVEKMQKTLANCGASLEGSEIIVEYDDTDDIRQQVGQSTITPVFPQSQLLAKYPALYEKIKADVEAFSFDTIDESFAELKGMTSAEALKVENDLFEKWDIYKKQLLVDSNAKYLEYDKTAEETQAMSIPTVPQINTTAIPEVPHINNMGAVPPVASPVPPVASPVPPVASPVPPVASPVPPVASPVPPVASPVPPVSNDGASAVPPVPPVPPVTGEESGVATETNNIIGQMTGA